MTGRARLLLVAAVIGAGCSSSSPRTGPLPVGSTVASTTAAASAPGPPATTRETAASGPAAVPASGGTAACTGRRAPTTYDHVVWIWMENHSSVLRSSAATYERSVAGACASALNDADVGSPSLPNYIGATSGSTWGIGDDAGPGSHRLTADNIFRQVRAAGGSERSYEEDMMAPCQLTSAGRYAVKHNPAAYYDGADDRVACGRDDVPLVPGLGADIDAGTLPTFAFVTPDLCNDTHDCGIGTGDAWLARWVPRIVAGPDYRAGRTAVFVVWDEPTPMAELVIAPSVRPGTTVATRTTHYDLLRTTEEMLGLPLLGAAGTALDLRPQLGI